MTPSNRSTRWWRRPWRKVGRVPLHIFPSAWRAIGRRLREARVAALLARTGAGVSRLRGWRTATQGAGAGETLRGRVIRREPAPRSGPDPRATIRRRIPTSRNDEAMSGQQAVETAGAGARHQIDFAGGSHTWPRGGAFNAVPRQPSQAEAAEQRRSTNAPRSTRVARKCSGFRLFPAPWFLFPFSFPFSRS